MFFVKGVRLKEETLIAGIQYNFILRVGNALDIIFCTANTKIISEAKFLSWSIFTPTISHLFLKISQY